MPLPRLPQPIGATLSTAFLLSTLLFAPLPAAHAQVVFQQFYYPIDKPTDGKSWWQEATTELPELAKIGIYAVWHPVPVKGGSGAVSMGYDPYDLYDLGSKRQKGTIPTNFGTKDDYLTYVAAAHANGLRVFADVVLNHTGGADMAEVNPLMAQLGMDDIPDDAKVPPAFRPQNYDPATMNFRSWTRFTPVGADGTVGTGRFPRDARHFHPSVVHPDRNQPYHNPEFGADYCYEAENRYVWNGLCDWGRWFRDQTGVDGFRLDAVKLIDPPFLADFAAQVKAKKAAGGEPFFLVGEYWDTNASTLLGFQRATQHQMRLFDFGLFYALWDMTEKPQSFDMRDLWTRRLAERDRAVMFVSNHDVDRFQPIKRDRRILPYALTMTLAGMPSVFYLDYFHGANADLKAALPALIDAHNRYAHGQEILRFADTDVLAVERKGSLLGVFNDGGEGKPRTVTIDTAFGPNTVLQEVGRTPQAAAVLVATQAGGKVTVTVRPGDYVLLAPKSAIPAPDRFPRKARTTTQVFTFADDLDTGRLSDTPRLITITPAANTRVSLRLTDTTGAGQITVQIQDAAGKMLTTKTGKRGKPLAFRFTTKDTPCRISLTAPGTATTGRLSLTYIGSK